MTANPNSRFTQEAAELLRNEIIRSGGIEVFAIGVLNDDGFVSSLSIHCRGNKHSVPALLTRPKAGEVVIHNHPSGLLVASQADMYLANLYGEDGVGVVIVNNDVTRALWVVEPHNDQLKPVLDDEILHFFHEQLPKAIPNFEARQGQIDMALHVAKSINKGEVGLIEAGTGTGKSLAYLLPSVLWAKKNKKKVVIATFTITLQRQLVHSDIPILAAAGIDFEHALIKGRNNYICRRRFLERKKNTPDDPIIQTIEDYIESTTEGSKADIAIPLPSEVWEDIGSDHDQTLRARCPHFQQCFYYQARRRAAKANILIANHHLLMADLLVKGETGGEGILPRYNRIILDEGHHLEDAATSLFRKQLSSQSIKRAIRPLIKTKKVAGALEKVELFHIPHLDDKQRQKALKHMDELKTLLPNIRTESDVWFQQIASDTLSNEVSSFRLKPEFSSNPLWRRSIEPTINQAALRLGRASDRLAQLEDILNEIPEEDRLREIQPLLTLQKSKNKLAGHAGFLQAYKLIGAKGSSITEDPTVRWIEKVRGKLKVPTAQLSMAPIEVGPTLRENVFSRLKTVVACSATMTVNNRFEHFRTRVGLSPIPPNISIHEGMYPSPFDYPNQAFIGLPTDLPQPSHTDFLQQASRFINEAIRCSNGGVFVLCTSYYMLRRLAEQAQKQLGSQYRIFYQGQMGRFQLLDAFLKTPNSILFGADSFWEGVSVQGDNLRMVIIPKLPFRVPSEPVEQARHELLEAQGKNPFREYSLPQAALKLRQGFGRLIRSQTDRGAVLILDPRINQKWYGQTFLRSLPQMRHHRMKAIEILNHLQMFFAQTKK